MIFLRTRGGQLALSNSFTYSYPSLFIFLTMEQKALATSLKITLFAISWDTIPTVFIIIKKKLCVILVYSLTKDFFSSYSAPSQAPCLMPCVLMCSVYRKASIWNVSLPVLSTEIPFILLALSSRFPTTGIPSSGL